MTAAWGQPVLAHSPDAGTWRSRCGCGTEPGKCPRAVAAHGGTSAQPASAGGEARKQRCWHTPSQLNARSALVGPVLGDAIRAGATRPKEYSCNERARPDAAYERILRRSERPVAFQDTLVRTAQATANTGLSACGALCERLQAPMCEWRTLAFTGAAMRSPIALKRFAGSGLSGTGAHRRLRPRSTDRRVVAGRALGGRARGL